LAWVTKTPFRNTTDLFKINPQLIWQLKGRKTTSKFFDKLKEEEIKHQNEEKKEVLKFLTRLQWKAKKSPSVTASK
jgi:hypothetical protein